MKPIHIGDRLTDTHRAIQGGIEEIGRVRIADLLKEARDRIHELEGVVFSYPPSEHAPEGTTWRKEYEDLYDTMLKMTPEEFMEWQTAMKD
jgi:hypothetical protein